ncbi:MAG: outer membrane protein transport protein [Pseudomonadota bacterium]
MNTFFTKGALAAVTVSMLGTSALAGGFDRGGVNIDQLFDQERFSARATLSHVMPDRALKNVQRANTDATAAAIQGAAAIAAGVTPAQFGGLPAATQAALITAVTPIVLANPQFTTPDSSAKVSVKGDYTNGTLGWKMNLGQGLDCLGTYTKPFGANATYGENNAYSVSATQFSVDTDDYGLTCSYQFGLGETSVGDSFFRIIAGGSYQELTGFQARQRFLDLSNAGIGAAGGVTNTAGIGTFTASGEAAAYRLGAAYEIPSIALRAAVIYTSAYDYSLNGIQDNTGFGAVIPGTQLVPITASTEIPQSVEVRLQSGINERTLGFLNVKWQEWSKLGIIPINGGRSPVTGLPTQLSFDPLYRDGWTVSGGIGRVLTEELTGSVSLGWDRGTSTITGTQTDTYTLSAGVRYQPTENFELSVGGLVGMLTSGTSQLSPFGDAANQVTYSFDDDLVTAVSIAAKIKY